MRDNLERGLVSRMICDNSLGRDIQNNMPQRRAFDSGRRRDGGLTEQSRIPRAKVIAGVRKLKVT